VTTYTVKDGCNNTVIPSPTYTYSGGDATAPTPTCEANQSIVLDASCRLAVPNLRDGATATDNCSTNFTWTQSPSQGVLLSSGGGVTHTVTVTVTDDCNKSATCTVVLTGIDAVAPTITCPSSVSKNTDANQCTAVHNYSVTGNDNCGGWSLTRVSGLASGSQFPIGSTTVLWRNTDGAGNSTTCSFTVTVTDAQIPSITCPSNITTSTATNSCSKVVNYANPTFADNCSGATLSLVSGGASGSSFNKGTNTVEWKVTDASGNSKTCNFTIRVNDTQAPTITCPNNITANAATGSCSAVVNYGSPVASDNCMPAPLIARRSGLASGSTFSVGVNSVVFRATDGAGLTSDCTLRITVVDNQLPTINCPAPIVRNTDANLCTAVATYSVTASDNCNSGSVTLSRISGLASGSPFPRGINTVVWRATDVSGNTTACSFTVTVNDIQLPVITCPSSINTNTTTGQCNRVVNYANPTYSDNCSGGAIFLFSGLASGSVFPTGTSTVVWRAVDNTGINSTTCSFTVTVTDNELPIITCPPATTVTGTGSPCGFPSAQLNPATASDNCAVTSLTSNAPTNLPAGTSTVIWTAKDAANNLATCFYSVTVTCGSAPNAMATKNKVVKAIDNDLGLALSPNPAHQEVLITISGIQDESADLSIFDALGRQVWRKTLTGGLSQISIDLTTNEFADGLYQVTLRSKSAVVTKSLVIHR